MKYCKDCRWAIKPDAGWSNARCLKCAMPAKVDLVTGETVPGEQMYCVVARDSLVNGRCGPEGKLFEPVETKVNP